MTASDQCEYSIRIRMLYISIKTFLLMDINGTFSGIVTDRLLSKKRDKLAKAAMTVLLRKAGSCCLNNEEVKMISQSAYALADAMMERRKKD